MNLKENLSVSQAILKFLHNQYICIDEQEWPFFQALFAIFGHGNVSGLGEAIVESSFWTLPFYKGQNEQGMAHAAIALAKQKRCWQAGIVTSSVGPGAMNMVTSAALATSNRIPVLLLPGDVFASRQPDPVLQQISGIQIYENSANTAFQSVSRYWDRINRPEQIYVALMNAMHFLTQPALRGAVTLCLPQDVQSEIYAYEKSFFQKRVHYIKRECLNDKELEYIIHNIEKSKKPVIICGGGVLYSEAENDLAQLVERFSIPVVSTQAGQGALCFQSPYNLGGVGVTGTLMANRAISQADLILVFGSKLGDFTTASKSLFASAKIININVSLLDAQRMGAKTFQADCRQALRQIYAALDYSGTQYEILPLRRAWEEEKKKIMEENTSHSLSQLQCILSFQKNLLQSHDTIVAAAGSLPGDLQRFFPVYDSRSYHLEYGFSCMGYEISGAVGVKIADPSREVFAFCGDGSFLMLHSEIVTAIQENIKINIVLFDNQGYQCIDNLQTSKGIRSFGNELKKNYSNLKQDKSYLSIDFPQIARGYGLVVYEVRSLRELEEAVELVRKEKRSTLTYIPVARKSMSHSYEAWWRTDAPAQSENVSIQDQYIKDKLMKETIKEY